MENISIKLEKEWYCLQEGFEWNNIPRLAVITGVNGAGKTHLFRLFHNIGDTQKGVIKHAVKVFNSKTKDAYRLALFNGNNITMDGLVAYHSTRNERIAKITAHRQKIKEFNRDIQLLKKQIKKTSNNGQLYTLNQNIIISRNQIQQLMIEIDNLDIFAYNQELKSIALKIGKRESYITIENLKEFANPIFNSFNDIQDFTRYIQQFESNKNSLRIQYSKELKFDRIIEIETEKKIHEKINELFIRFGFDHYKMKDPYSTETNWDGKLIFINNTFKEFGYESLSSGEQMIVQFVIWAMAKDQRGNRINTMVLDEPDAHLHPKMCRMMVEILEEISRPEEEGGSGIRVIITTHSPSTVAFATEGSLFVLEKDEKGKRTINQKNTKVAMHMLSEGIFTFDKAIDSFLLISNSKKKLIVCTEGKTDLMHINIAMKKLGRQLDVEVIDLHDAGTLANFIKSTPSTLFGGKKVIAVFDNDPEGQKANLINGIEGIGYKKISAAQCEGKSFTCLLPLPDVNLDKYCPIEYLYSIDILKAHDVLEKRNYQEFTVTYKAKTPEEGVLISNEYIDESTLRPFKVKDNIKNQFSEKVKDFNVEAFVNFNPLLDIFEQILKENDM